MSSRSRSGPVEGPPVSVVVPAHNEEAVIGRLLRQLLAGAYPGELELIIVANGCTDRTAEIAQAVAAEFPPAVARAVRVIEVGEASKHTALRLGDQIATSYPRVWIDGDVVIGIRDLRFLRDAVCTPGVLAAGPTRSIELRGRPMLVRWYYDIWTRLPAVQSGLFGRGVVAMSAEGHARVQSLPPVMGDDLIVSLAFQPSERAVLTSAMVVLHTPRNVRDLIRRRVRVMTSTGHVERVAGEMAAAGGPERTRTTSRDLMKIVWANPVVLPKVAVFLGLGVIAHWRSARAMRRGDFTTWLRDESSRSG